jgi:Xaa-Pro aminopeptidase
MRFIMRRMTSEAINRVAILQREMSARGIGVCVIGPSENLRYVLGYDAMALERLTALVVSPTGAAMILPDFDAAEFADVDGRPPVATWSDRHGPARAVEEAFALVGRATTSDCASAGTRHAASLIHRDGPRCAALGIPGDLGSLVGSADRSSRAANTSARRVKPISSRQRPTSIRSPSTLRPPAPSAAWRRRFVAQVARLQRGPMTR